ncbi:MAG TPA: DNA/RNA non-specific endonuclease, partial [Chitinophagaceae bacterium]|nr:DNA/RNA non-specific endonuclease [Chitinophagaceae bacterium]
RESHRAAIKPDLVKPIIFSERIIKENDLKELAPNELARIAGKPVARIENIPAAGLQAEGFATGFLVSPNLLMTNNHVFPDSNSAKDCAANFLYERTSAGISAGFQFFIDPAKFFYTNKNLDFSLVYVEPVSLDNKFSLTGFGFLRMISTPGKILVGQPINIIQHPSGGIKQYAYQNNTVVDILNLEHFIHYTTDTEKGSSGSPCYNTAWDLAALHHSGVPLVIDGKIINDHGQPWDEKNQGDDEIQWIANEGISISAIVSFLKTIQLNKPPQQNLLDVLIRTTNDPLLTGSPVSAPNPIPVPSTNNESFNNLNSTDMSSITMNFTGPTNIFIGEASGKTVAAIAVAPAVAANANGFTKSLTEKKQNFDPDYDHRPGYDRNFLSGHPLDLPEVISSRQDEMFLDFSSNKPYVLRYHNYSLIMNKKRRLTMWTASNVDYNPDKKSTRDRSEFGGEDWTVDPRIPAKYQIVDEEFYKPAKKIDRGHIVRREDNCWGDSELEIEYANADSYHWTNCTQQHQSFNRDAFGEHGLWGMLENRVQQQLILADGRATILAGPVLDNVNDPVAIINGVNIQYPLKFWKIIVAVDEQEGPVSYGFILDQSDVINDQGIGLERLDFSTFKAQQATIHAISSLTGVVFDKAVYDTDALNTGDVGREGLRTFRNVNEILFKRKRLQSDKYAEKVNGNESILAN